MEFNRFSFQEIMDRFDFYYELFLPIYIKEDNFPLFLEIGISKILYLFSE